MPSDDDQLEKSVTLVNFALRLFIFLNIYILACNLKRVTHIYSILALYINAGREENPQTTGGIRTVWSVFHVAQSCGLRCS